MFVQTLVFTVLIKMCFCKLSDFNVGPPVLFTDDSKFFLRTLIEQTYYFKKGYLLTIVNEVDSEYVDYIAKLFGEKTLAIIINVKDNIPQSMKLMEEAHFKICLMDSQRIVEDNVIAIFPQVRNIRSVTALFLLNNPMQFHIDSGLRMYEEINAVNMIIIYESLTKNITEVYSINPYLPKKKRHIRLTEVKNKINIFFDKASNLYGNKIRALLTEPDFTKFTLKKNQIEYHGKDYETWKTISQTLNGQLEIINIEKELGAKHPWNLDLNYSNRREAQIAFLRNYSISCLATSQWFKSWDLVFEQIYPHTMNNLRVLVPKTTAPAVFKMYQSLRSSGYWLVGFLFVLGVYILSPLVQYCRKKPFNLCYVHMILIEAQLLSQITRFPKNSYFRVLCLGMIFYFTVESVAVQSKFTSSLMSDKLQIEVDTIEDLESTDWPLLIRSMYSKEFNKQYINSRYNNLLSRVQTLTEKEMELNKTLLNLDAESKLEFALITEEDIARYCRSAKKYYREGLPLFHLMEETVMPSFQSYKITYGNPLLPKVTKIIRRLSEGGLIDLWAKRAHFDGVIEGFLYPDHWVDKPLRSLSLKQTWYTFVMWAILLVVASCTFLAELLLWHCYHKNRQ